MGKHTRVACAVQVDWTGLMIGQRHCTVHDMRWEPPSMKCPAEGTPAKEARRA